MNAQPCNHVDMPARARRESREQWHSAFGHKREQPAKSCFNALHATHTYKMQDALPMRCEHNPLDLLRALQPHGPLCKTLQWLEEDTH